MTRKTKDGASWPLSWSEQRLSAIAGVEDYLARNPRSKSDYLMLEAPMTENVDPHIPSTLFYANQMLGHG